MEISCHTMNLKQAGSTFSFGSSSMQMQKQKVVSNRISCRAASTWEKQCVGGRDLYQVLSLESSEKVGLEEIKKAYRGMARQCHPDVVPASRREESTRRFVELQRAYQTLSDPVSRHRYDCELLGIKGVSRTSSPNFSRENWEDQLSGLQSKSHSRTHSQTTR